MNKHDAITTIAREQMGIETLESRNRDSLDFHDVSVASVQRALAAAYDAGRDELLAAAEALLAAKDDHMETAVEWRRLRRAIKSARKSN